MIYDHAFNTTELYFMQVNCRLGIPKAISMSQTHCTYRNK